MSDRVSNLVELVVGLGCMGAAIGVWRMRSRRWLAAVFAIAGLSAAIHATVSLAR